jgi:GTP cyclohydrolase I
MGQSFGREAHSSAASDFDPRQVIDGVRTLLAGFGVDVETTGMQETPRRVAEMYGNPFRGLISNPDSVLDVVFDENYDELVLVKNISFVSMCKHHLLPFIGQAHVGYIPNDRGQITGLSKLARVVDVLTRRPTVQEEVTAAIADSIERVLSPQGIIVLLEAEQLCLAMRGF